MQWQWRKRRAGTHVHRNSLSPLDGDPHSAGHVHRNSNPVSDQHRDSDIFSVASAYRHGNPNPKPHSDGNSYSVGHRHGDSNSASDKHAKRHRNSDIFAVTATHRHGNRNPEPDVDDDDHAHDLAPSVDAHSDRDVDPCGGSLL